MICIRKHAIIDQQWQYLHRKGSQFKQYQDQTNPKYVLPINLQQKLEWSFDRIHKQFNGFLIEWKNEKKIFNMSDSYCRKLKSQIDGKILYNEINSQYFPIQILGEGNFGKVIKVVSLVDQKKYACKVMKLNKKFSKNDIIYELMTMQSLNHENIINIKEVYSSKSNFFVIMDYCRGGTLRDYMAHRTLSQDQIVIIMKQILNALIYMNSKGYIHRDIKPENILLREQNDIYNIKVCDFGFAAKVEDIFIKYPNCGTPGYMAPEVIKYNQTNPYNEQCDVFSCGSLLYSILTGYNLQVQSEESEIYNIEAQVYEEKQLTSCNNQFKNILLKMLKNVLTKGQQQRMPKNSLTILIYIFQKNIINKMQLNKQSIFLSKRMAQINYDSQLFIFIEFQVQVLFMDFNVLILTKSFIIVMDYYQLDLSTKQLYPKIIMQFYRKYFLFIITYHILNNGKEILLGENTNKIKYTFNFTSQTVIIGLLINKPINQMDFRQLSNKNKSFQ